MLAVLSLALYTIVGLVGTAAAADAPFAANGKAVSEWAAADVFAFVDTLNTLQPNAKKVLRAKAKHVMVHHHTSSYPIPDDCPIEGKPMAACPYPFNGTFLLGLKKETLMTKGHWEEVEILMADNAVTAILTARDRYVDAWLALHEDDGPDVAESAPPLVYQDETAPDLGPQHSYDGKQVGMWSSGDVAEWLKSLGALSDEEKGQVKDKFRAIKADEEEGVDHKFNMHNAPFNGVDLHFVKEKHLTNPGTTKKTALVEGLARRLIEARDAIVKVTDYIDTANSLSLDDPEALAKHFTGRPMWDWVHSNVQEFFLSMELKRDVKKALSYQLSDWMIWHPVKGTGMISGQQMMMSERDWRKLFNGVFSGGPGQKKVDDMCLAWKHYLKNEKEEFKKGRQLVTPQLDEDDPDFGKANVAVSMSPEEGVKLIGGGPVEERLLHGGPPPKDDDDQHVDMGHQDQHMDMDHGDGMEDLEEAPVLDTPPGDGDDGHGEHADEDGRAQAQEEWNNLPEHSEGEGEGEGEHSEGEHGELTEHEPHVYDEHGEHDNSPSDDEHLADGEHLAGTFTGNPEEGHPEQDSPEHDVSTDEEVHDEL